MDLTLEQLEFLAGPEGARLLASDLPAEPLRQVEALRRVCGAGEAAAVAELLALRRRAAASGRFAPDFAAKMLATDKLLQQASSMRLAFWKGRRLAELLGGSAGPDGRARTVWDLCCGLGGDTIGLAAAGFDVRAVDSDPSAVLCAGHNAAAAGFGPRCRFEVGDAGALDVPTDAVVHADPDRRASGKRSIDLADFSPDASVLAGLASRTTAGGIKLPPGIDAADLERIPASRYEYVSEGGVCKQFIAWWHPGATPGREGPRRRATVLSGPLEEPRAASIDAGVAPYAPIGKPGRWLFEPDPALIAAEAVDDLAAAEGLWRIAVGLPWLFGDRPLQTALAACFEVLADVPGRVRDVTRAARRLEGGTVEVKPRGLKLNTDRLQRQLRGKGKKTLAVLWCRLGRKQRAFICRRNA